jgi:signal transduction histidine kinase
MGNRKKSALDLTTQLFVGRVTTPADELMSAFPHTDAINPRLPWRQRPIKLITRGAMGGKFDARKLERVFFNLLLNAREATTRRGNISVEIRSDKEQFRIRVCDDGSGVPVVIRHTLFEPAVTAAKSNGRGFGLAVVREGIDDHQGSVEVESTSELGTIMLVKLPRVHQNRCRQKGIAHLLSTKSNLPSHSNDVRGISAE